jgi:hypothetical protein
MATLVAWGETMFPPTSPPSFSQRRDLRAPGLRANESPFGPQSMRVTNEDKRGSTWLR